MINFSKYTLLEIQAIVQVLDNLTDDMPENDIGYTVAMSYYHVARMYEDDIMRQHEHAMALQARAAGDPPAAADPPAPPDMFGWVGDALDDLCAAGEVIGNDR